MSLLRTYLHRVHKHQFLTAQCAFLSNLDEITTGMLKPTISAKFPEMFVTRSIDKVSYCISTLGIILLVEGRASDKNIDYFKPIRTGTEVYRS